MKAKPQTTKQPSKVMRRFYPLRNLQLQLLLCMAAAGFGIGPQCILFQTTDKALEQFAVYTAEAVKNSTDADHGFRRLYRHIYPIGKVMGALCRVAGHRTGGSAAQKLVVWLYRNISITVQWSDAQCFTVTECFFSRYYTPQVCSVMSGMDSGIVQGITGMEPLQFFQRITQGHAVCAACLGIDKDIHKGTQKGDEAGYEA